MNFRADARPKIGQLVILKGINSPQMVVKEVIDENVTTIWFDLANKCHEHTFSYTLLTILSESTYVKSFVTKQGLDLTEYIKDPTFRGYIDADQKIRAIKQLRELARIGLKEAKDAVDELIINKRW